MEKEEALSKFRELIEIIKAMGWACAFDASDSQAPLEGMIVGHPDYVKRVANLLEKDRVENGH